MSLDQVVNISISRTAASVSRASFGTALILGSSATWSDKYRTYTSLTGVAADFSTGSAEYLAASKMFSQALQPTSILIGKRAAAVAQVDTIAITTVADNTTYTHTINGTAFTVTSGTGATATSISTLLIAAINGGTQPVTATTAGNGYTVTATTAGQAFTSQVSANMGDTATTANYGAAEDLTAMENAGASWYATMLTSRTTVDILAAAGWTEARRKLFFACSSDANVITSSTTDVASKLKALKYARTAYLYSGDQANYPEASWLGGMLPRNPGSATFKFKTLVGNVVDSLTASQLSYATGKSANTYTTVGGTNIVAEGVVADGEYIDIILGLDWLQANLQADIYQALVNEPKVPYTDAGITAMATIIQNRLNLGVKQGVLAESPAPWVTAPLSANVTASDRSSRTLNGLTFGGQAAGAIHQLTVTGNVTT